MSNFPVVRSKSSFCLPRQRDIEKEGTVATLSRVTSVPNVNNLYPDLHYRPSSLHKYRRNYNEFDDYIHDRFSYQPTLYWAESRYQGRRYATTDPVPDSIGLDYPAFWYRYKWYSDWLNPTYWRKHRDPHYDRPLWDSWKPYMLDRSNTKRAIDMYRKGIISFGYLDRNWITPWALGHRREKDWADIYTPAGRYGTRRYFYSFAA